MPQKIYRTKTILKPGSELTTCMHAQKIM